MSVKKMANPLGDEGSQEAFRTVGVLKGSASDLSQLIKLTRTHHAAMQNAIESGKQLVDHLVKITTKMEPRIGGVSQAFIEMSTAEKGVFGKFEEYNNFLLENVAQKLTTQMQQERGAIQEFEKGYHKQHQDLIAQVKKAEKNVKKAGKKSPQDLQNAIQNLTERMNAITTHRQNRLEEILLMERARYCNVVSMWGAVIDAQINFYQNSASNLAGQNPKWKEIGATGSQLSAQSRDLLAGVGVKERTSTSLISSGNTANEGYYEEGYYEEGYYEEGYEGYYEEGYEEGYYEEGYEEGYYEEGYDQSYQQPAAGYPTPGGYAAPQPAAPGSFQARALYDYQGTHDYELQFNAGDIITVTQEDPSTGWWTGEVHGRVGPFPGNYVERI
mmetsp:Transcript_7109/g.14924  ORF Transcript_7109/g.14924 Transcript_7109/m.14924 type:complete len:386 (+) Transcript_7109:15-1172(+)